MGLVAATIWAKARPPIRPRVDEALGLMSGTYTPQVQEAITLLGSRLPFGEARDELALWWGIKISSGGVRHITLRYGQIADELMEVALTPTAN